MIWGKTTHERDAETQARQQWHEQYVYLPHRLKDIGQWAWLQKVWVRDIFHPEQGITRAWWERVYFQNLPIPGHPISPNSTHQPPVEGLYCVFCQEKGSAYPVCHPCRKALMAFRAIADA